MPYEERKLAGRQGTRGNYYEKALLEAGRFREQYEERKGVIRSDEMPWEECSQGHIKHIANENMETAECALNIYLQTLFPGGSSGKHRHMAEEIFFVLEGAGYDLHWDVDFDILDEYSWSWAEEPKRYEWEEGDFVYIPPYTMHQHFNADSNRPARFLTATNRMLKCLGLDWLEQLAAAPGNRAMNSG